MTTRSFELAEVKAPETNFNLYATVGVAVSFTPEKVATPPTKFAVVEPSASEPPAPVAIETVAEPVFVVVTRLPSWSYRATIG